MSTKLNKLLCRLSACPEAQTWCSEYESLADAWTDCERADWMLWLVGRMAGRKGWPDRKQVVLAACACAYGASAYGAYREKELKAMAKIVRKMLTVPELA